MAGAAQAATQYTVGTLADDGSAATDCTNAANVDCTLRRAVTLANLDTAADKVVFRSSLSGTINLNPGGQIEINEPLNIQGPGASKVTLYGEDTTRLFYVNPNTQYDPVTISGLTLTHGYVMGEGGGAISSNYADLTVANAVIADSKVGGGQRGGGIYSLHGALTINSSTITGNYSAGNGGGIGSKYADVSVKDSTVSGNYAVAYGGGIWTDQADLTASRSTLTGNDASQDGGGTYSSSHGVAIAVKVERSTVSGNHAIGDDGGGVWVCCGSDGAALTVVGSTITGNTAATYGGGLNAYLEDPVLEDSIVSGNTATPATSSDLHETYVSGYFQTAFSLVGIPGGYVAATVPLSNLFGVNPQLGALANNGGPTQTRLPATTSPVVNKGKSFGLTTDQRGLTRPVAFPGVANSTAAGADGADIGAVELQFTPTPAGPTTTPPATPPATHKKKCKKKKKHKRSAESAKKKKCKKKKK
jgi:hypothetical protein